MPTRATNQLLVEDDKVAGRVPPGIERARHWIAQARHLWRMRVKILLWALAGGGAAALLTLKICAFEATVQIMPPDSGAGGLSALAVPAMLKSPGMAGLAGLAGDMLGVKSTGALYVRVLQSRVVEDNIVDHFYLRAKYGKKYFEDARNVLEDQTKINEDKKSGVLSITVRNRDAAFASSLAGAYVHELDMVMLQVTTSAARRERMFIEQRMQEEKRVLDDAELRFSQFASSSMALDIPQQTRVMVETAARLQGEMIAAKAEAEGLEQIYTAENTRMKTLRSRIAELQKAINKINTGGMVKGAAPDPSSPYPSVKNLPLVGVEWTNLFRNTKIHETVFELLTQQYEVARIQEAREIPTVKVLDVPVVPERRHPRPKIVMGIGVLLGALLACIGLLLQYKWNNLSEDDPWRHFLAHPFSGGDEFSGN